MKSVIAQGSSVAKAIDEALKRAGQPKEFFVKLLEEGQSGFLGFGSTKAKVVVFFKKQDHEKDDTAVLKQSSYKNLFNNKVLDKQVVEQDQDSRPKQGTKKPAGQQQRQQRKGGQRPSRHDQSKDRKPGQQTQQQRKRPQKPMQPKQEQKEVAVKEVREVKVREIKPKDKQAQQRSRRPRQGSRWGQGKPKSNKTGDENKS